MAATQLRQTCTALTRMLVPEKLYPEAAKLAAEVAKASPSATLGREHKARAAELAAQLERVRAYIKKGVAEGAELVAAAPSRPRACRRAAITCGPPSSAE